MVVDKGRCIHVIFILQNIAFRFLATGYTYDRVYPPTAYTGRFLQ